MTLVCAGAARAQGDLVADVDREARRAEGAPAEPGAAEGPTAPEIRASDIHNQSCSLRDYAGQNIVLTFLSPKCYRDAIAWLEGVQTNFLGDPSVVFVNVLFPGPTPAFASRSASLKTIRDHIDEYLADVRQRMPNDDRQRLDHTDIRWIVDWRQDIHKRYDVEVDRVHIFLIDRQGRVREHIGRRTPATEKRLTEVVDELRHQHSDQ